MDVHLVEQSAGHFRMEGDLTFATVADALEQSKSLFADHDRIVLDLASVKESDSAGLALLLEWINWARHYVREIQFDNVPDRIIAIAQISEVENLLTAGERWTGPDGPISGYSPRKSSSENSSSEKSS